MDAAPINSSRSGAFPFEIARRLILMFSVQSDLVLDPFAGTMTTALAAMGNARSSLSVEIDPALCAHYGEALLGRREALNAQVTARIEAHRDFVTARVAAGDNSWYDNQNHGFSVKTRQEAELCLPTIEAIERAGEGVIRCRHT